MMATAQALLLELELMLLLGDRASPPCLRLRSLTSGAGPISWWVWIPMCCLLWVTVGSVLGGQKLLTLGLETLRECPSVEFRVAEPPCLECSASWWDVHRRRSKLPAEAEPAGRSRRRCW